MFDRFQFIDRLLRRIFFSRRSTRYARSTDIELRHMVINRIADRERADAELELDTRQWLRDFWSRSLVAWISLLVSVAAFTLAICSYNMSLRVQHGAGKTLNTANK
jgi:hypothetical protein